jgi:hypothetical protein
MGGQSHFLDGIQIHIRELDLAPSAVDMLTQLKAFRLTSVQLAAAHGAINSLTQSMAFGPSSMHLAWLTAL